jgi:hypothetical protein
MGRPTNDVSMQNALCGLSNSLRTYWRQLNREQRAKEAAERAERKATDKKRAKCRCEAYPWPHRPAGGLCRWPDPPVERYYRMPGPRRYRDRYAGLRRRVARANGLHPIRDRAAIDALMPRVLAQARELKRRYPRLKYRNMVITATGVTGEFQTSGPKM